jgi:hypothetical protein
MVSSASPLDTIVLPNGKTIDILRNSPSLYCGVDWRVCRWLRCPHPCEGKSVAEYDTAAERFELWAVCDLFGCMILRNVNDANLLPLQFLRCGACLRATQGVESL